MRYIVISIPLSNIRNTGPCCIYISDTYILKLQGFFVKKNKNQSKLPLNVIISIHNRCIFKRLLTGVLVAP